MYRLLQAGIAAVAILMSPSLGQNSAAAIPLKFFSAEDASHARRCEGPHGITRDRPQSVVRVLLRLAAAEATKNRLSRDFGSCSIFDFFDSIDPKATSHLSVGVH
jgi:hypothetical protein